MRSLRVEFAERGCPGATQSPGVLGWAYAAPTKLRTAVVKVCVELGFCRAYPQPCVSARMYVQPGTLRHGCRTGCLSLHSTAKAPEPEVARTRPRQRAGKASGTPGPLDRNAFCESVQQRDLWTDFLEPRPPRSPVGGERPSCRRAAAAERRPAGRAPVYNPRYCTARRSGLRRGPPPAPKPQCSPPCAPSALRAARPVIARGRTRRSGVQVSLGEATRKERP